MKKIAEWKKRCSFVGPGWLAIFWPQFGLTRLGLEHDEQHKKLMAKMKRASIQFERQRRSIKAEFNAADLELYGKTVMHGERVGKKKFYRRWGKFQFIMTVFASWWRTRK